MLKNIRLTILISAIILSLIFPFVIFSETREELETELQKIEQQIADYEKELVKTKTQKQTLINKINQLKKEQKKLSLQIKFTDLQINKLGQQLSSVEDSIQNTTQKLKQLKEQISEILRAIYKQNQKSLIEVILEEQGLSAFFMQLEALEQLSQNLTLAVNKLKVAKEELKMQYADLEIKQNEKKNLLYIQMLQKQNLQTKTNEQNKLLKDTRGKENRYQAMLADSKKRAQEIRSRIYELLGVSVQITFGEAVEVAQWVEKMTGVRAAFLLAVLTQESNLGKNVGQCTLVDTTSGHSRSIKTGKIFKNGIHPTRDLPLFLTITSKIGKDPINTAISCPMVGISGYGGAMGPAQFIPSTWMLYEDKVSSVIGKNLPNPWNIKDAFVASALLLKDNGATSGKKDAEWRAAMLYFSGSTNPKFRFYGDNVIALMNKYEEDIKSIRQ